MLGWAPATGESVTMTGFVRELDKQASPKFTELKDGGAIGNWDRGDEGNGGAN